MKSIDIVKIGTKVITSNITTLDQERFPIDGVWYLVGDMGATKEQVHKYIFEDVKPTHKEPLF